MTRFALLALVLTLPLSASAQKTPPKDAAPAAGTAQALPAASMTLPDTLRPGDLSIVAPAAGEVTYTVRLITPMQQDIGTLTETTEIADGVVTRTAVVSVPMAGQNETTVSTIDAGTWGVASMTMDGTMTVGALTLDGDRATGTRGMISEPGETLDPQPVDEAAPGAYFGGGWPDAIVRSMALTEGAVHHVMVYSPRDGVTTERVTVLGEQNVKPAGGASQAFIAVETFDGEQTMMHFVDPATKNIMLVRFSPQPGVEVEFARD